MSAAYLPHVGGIEVLLHDVCVEYQRRGHESQIVTADRSGPAEVDGVPVHRLDIDRPMQAKNAAAIHAARRQLAGVVDRFCPDVVHSHDMGPLLWLYQRTTRNRRYPLVVAVHNAMTESRDLTVASRGAMAALLGGADVVTAVSGQALDDTLRYAPFLQESIVHIANGVVPAPAGESTVDRTLLVGVGRLVHQKGWDIGIDAMRLVHAVRPGVRVVIGGVGPEQAALQQRIDDNGLHDVVSQVGRLEQSEVRALMARAALVLMPSRFEGLPLVALEAAWAGRPVVGTRMSGLSEAVVDGRTGVLADPEQPALLADAVLGLLDDPVKADELGVEARSRAEAQYGLSACADS